MRVSNVNELETAKLFLSRTYHSQNYTRDYYFYEGVFHSPSGEKLPPNPELAENFRKGDAILGVFDSFQHASKGKNATEIFTEEFYSNMTLAKKIYDAPEGMYITDPCYIGSENSQSSVNSIPAGPWEITIKGCVSPTQSTGRVHMEYIHRTDPDEMFAESDVEGWEVTSWSPRATTMWILRPGATFENTLTDSVFYVDVDSGCAGAFPTELNQSENIWDEKYLDVALANLEKDNAYILDSGIFTGTTYGDGGYGAYELFNAEKESVGYVVCFASDSFISKESFDQDEADEKYMQEHDMENLAVAKELESKFIHRGLKIAAEKNVNGLRLHGELDGMLFNLRYAERKMHLNVGTTDAQYREHVEKHYASQGVTYLGKLYVPVWNDKVIDRRMYTAITDSGYPKNDYEILEELINVLEEVPAERQLFGK